MFGKIIILVHAILLTKVNGDAISDAEEQLDELIRTVQASISNAYNDIHSLQMKFHTAVETIEWNGRVSLNQKAQDVNAKLETLNDNLNPDATSCISDAEQVLNRLLSEFQIASSLCVLEKNNEGNERVRVARYVVDVAITKVYELEFRLFRCGTNLECVEQVLVEIGVDKNQIPQRIEDEVREVDGLFPVLQKDAEECASGIGDQYENESAVILEDVKECLGS